MRLSFFAYTSFSRQLALDFRDFVNRYPQDDRSWSECVRFGSQEGANLILVDDRVQVRRRDDPQPIHSCGHFHVLLGKGTPRPVADSFSQQRIDRNYEL